MDILVHLLLGPLALLIALVVFVISKKGLVLSRNQPDSRQRLLWQGYKSFSVRIINGSFLVILFQAISIFFLDPQLARTASLFLLMIIVTAQFIKTDKQLRDKILKQP